jgi:hypothetical protein
MIQLADYWMGRDAQYPLAMTPQIAANAARTVGLANALLETAELGGVRLPRHPTTMTQVASGWRPPIVNAHTPGARPNSLHMTAQAIDIYDPDGDLDAWLMSSQGLTATEALGLWMEHPACTKGWAHLQSLPPRSGNRCFYP